MSESVSPAPHAVLAYDGRIGELYRIFLVNLLLTIVTLGIWRFWATTRLRRYIWSRTSSGGERFEYDGTGMQLFIGFLLAIGLFIGLFVAAFLLGLALHAISPVLAVVPLILVYLAIFVLALGAPFSAQRYRLNHTIWRGIRGGMQGSMITYGLRSLGYYILAGLSFYQLLPWAYLRLLERRINASSFGTLHFTCRGRAGQLYVRFLLTFIAVIVLAVAVFGTFALIERPLFAMMTQPHSQLEQQMLIRRLTLPLIAVYLVFGIGVALISASFQAAFYRHVTSHSTLGMLHFASDVTTGDVVKLIIGNLLIIVFTLGLGLPIVIHRNAKFFTAHLLATGALDLSQIGQSPLPVSRFGEGMFQALDAGAGAL
jgi:uncharacterized membrane protein YjgN (DUF898 family)